MTLATRSRYPVPTEPGDTAEIVVAPVTITPTKPLTPTHVKGLVWADVLLRATARLTGTRLVWNSRAAHLTTQTTAFWHHLDRVEPDTDWSGETALGIGERYVRFHSDLQRPDPRALDDYFERVDEAGWIHPAGRRMLDLWRSELELLGIADPGFTADRPLGLSAAAALDALTRQGLVLDHRRFGGPLYLDCTRWGMPLRKMISTEGHPNYLMPILRDLIPMVRPDRVFLFLHDEELTPDYLLLERVLGAFGARTTRLSLSRVPVGETNRSSRYGGWAGSTLGELFAVSGTADRAAYRLGMRLYFAGTLDRNSAQSFQMSLLRRCVGRAARLLEQTVETAGAAADDTAATMLLSRMLTRQGYVDPYRLTVSLLGKRPTPLSPALREIYI